MASLEIGGLQWKAMLIVVDLPAFIVEKDRFGLLHLDRLEGGRLRNLIPRVLLQRRVTLHLGTTLREKEMRRGPSCTRAVILPRKGSLPWRMHRAACISVSHPGLLRHFFGGVCSPAVLFLPMRIDLIVIVVGPIVLPRSVGIARSERVEMCLMGG